MATLHEFLGAIISHIDRGRIQSDVASLESAKIYKEHDLLSTFPIPKLRIEEVVIEVKVAFATSPASSKSFSLKLKEKLINRIAELASTTIKKNPSIRFLVQNEKSILTFTARMREMLYDIIPTEIEIDQKTISTSLVFAIINLITRNLLSDAVSTPKGKTPTTARVKEVSNFLNDIKRMENDLLVQIQDIISSGLEDQSSVKDRLDVLVTASELQAIPPEKLTHLKMTLLESDKVWTEIEYQDGTKKEKLIPS
jgi:hypothetical protein